MTEFLSKQSEVTPPILTVSALNQRVANLLERTFPLMWIAGEISNFTRAASGHWYFSLKDNAAQVRGVMFRTRAQNVDFVPREGDKVEVRALVTLYAARGDFQLSVEGMRRAGVGNQYEAFLLLKQQLEDAGLFAASRKRALPIFARTIGIVTSPQAAALRDVLTTLRRRAPHLRVILYPAPVQGDGAGVKIAAAISLASMRAECEVLLLCRGGGSIEDLWAFNHEDVARAIAACAMPVITGIGHETDFTIADFVADVRAATPTAAAEIAARPQDEWLKVLAAHTASLRRGFQRRFMERSQTLDWLSKRLPSPAATIRYERTKLHSAQTQLGYALRRPLINSQHAMHSLQQRLHQQRPDLRGHRLQLRAHGHRLTSGIKRHTAGLRLQLEALVAQLDLLNPQRTLERGYAIITDAHGRIARAPQQLQPHDLVLVRLAEGGARITLASVQPNLID